MKAAVHLGQDYQENLRTTKNTDFDKIKHLMDISQKLTTDQKQEVYGISAIDWNTIPWVAYFVERHCCQIVNSKTLRFL